MAPSSALTDDAKAVIWALYVRCKGVLTVAQLPCMTMQGEGFLPAQASLDPFRHLCMGIYPSMSVTGIRCIEKIAAAGSFILVLEEGDMTLTSKHRMYWVGSVPVVL